VKEAYQAKMENKVQKDPKVILVEAVGKDMKVHQVNIQVGQII
jgi:hypothetical protein